MKVAVLGASPKPERYSNKAVRMLRQHGHEVIPVNPAHAQIEGLKTVASLDDLACADSARADSARVDSARADSRGSHDIHTVTVYVGPGQIGPLIDSIIRLRPKRVIINPGAESDELSTRLKEAGIPALEACTLVMLSTGQF
jgi:predicted CoA-binding protein